MSNALDCDSLHSTRKFITLYWTLCVTFVVVRNETELKQMVTVSKNLNWILKATFICWTETEYELKLTIICWTEIENDCIELNWTEIDNCWNEIEFKLKLTVPNWIWTEIDNY